LVAGRFSSLVTVVEVLNAIIRSPGAGNVVLHELISRNSSRRDQQRGTYLTEACAIAYITLHESAELGGAFVKLIAMPWRAIGVPLAKCWLAVSCHYEPIIVRVEQQVSFLEGVELVLNDAGNIGDESCGQDAEGEYQLHSRQL
jgi:hypothetical protein